MAEQKVFVDNSASSPVNVAGTVTAAPTGTQDVNIVTSSPILSTTSVRAPSIKGVFDFSLANVAGVLAANNFLSLFNPVGSGKLVSFGSAFISSTAAGASAETEPMRGFRITTATGGTLQAASTIAKFITTDAAPVAEVRIGNPTVTLGAALFNSPPVISATVGSTNVHVIPVPGGLAPFILAEGEGIVMRTNAGDVDQRWNLSIVWSEI
jgi:hypothetical protein